MLDVLNLPEWRACSKAEVIEWMKNSRSPDKRVREFLIVRSQLRPVDVYCYLVARFGRPNGFQNFLRRDDSDNWIHWDFNIKAGHIDIYFAGTSREIHIAIEGKMTDSEWKDLILAVKNDYGRVGRAKSEILQSLENYVVFQNKYVILANICAGLHADIVDAEPREKMPTISMDYKDNAEEFKNTMDRISERATRLYGNSIKLRLMTPIMAESFVNMIIIILCRDEIRYDEARYQSFVRSNIPERLRLLSDYCDGFSRPIDTSSVAYANFMRVVDKRNYALHGNVDPLKDKIEVVYFDGRRPLFSTPGHNIERFFEHLEFVNDPQSVISDYEATHAFLLEILECMNDRFKNVVWQVIDDSYPGYEVKKRRVTKILPSHVVTGFIQGTRYDDELNVTW